MSRFRKFLGCQITNADTVQTSLSSGNEPGSGGSWTPVNFGASPTVNFDTTRGVMFSSGQPTRLTAPWAGYYWATGTFRWDDTGWNNSSSVLLGLRVNGTDDYGRRAVWTTESGVDWQSDGELFFMHAGDYVELVAAQNSGGSRTNTAASIDSLPSQTSLCLALAFTTSKAGGYRPPFIGCKFKLVSTDDSISSGLLSFTPVAWDTVVWDTGGFRDNVNTSRAKIPWTGYYLLGGEGLVYDTPNVASQVRNAFAVNGVYTPNGVYAMDCNVNYQDGTNGTVRGLVAIRHFTAGDYVELVVAQDSGSSLVVPGVPGHSSGNQEVFLAVEYLGT